MKIIGRPTKIRLPFSGGKLKKALEIWGKSWGRANCSNNHVVQWDRWIDNKLPLSPTTVRNDINNGIPLERLSQYSKCLNIPEKVLINEKITADSNIFRDLLFNCCRDDNIVIPFIQFSHTELQKAYNQYNSEKILNELFNIISGIYKCYWIENESSENILNCALSVDSIRNGVITGRAWYMFYDIEHHVKPVFFRWNNNLNMYYSSDNYTSMSHLLFTDPLNYRKIRYNNVFCLKGIQLSDNGMLNAQPTASHVYFEKQTDLKYEDVISEFKDKPVTNVSDKDFTKIKNLILSPFEL